MKRPVLLIFAIVFAILAVAVLGIMIASLSGRINMGDFISGGFSDMTTGELIAEETYDISSLKDLSVSTGDHEIAVSFTDDDFITIRQYSNEGAKRFTASNESGKLSIKLETTIQIAIFNFVGPRLEIYLPRDYEGNVSLATTSGGIFCNDFARWNNVNAESRSGNIRFENGIECASLTATSTSGAIRFGEITSVGDVRLQANSGNIRLEGDVNCNDLNVESTSGAIRLEVGIKCERFAAESTAGNVNIGEIVSDDDLSIKTTSGTIRLNNITAGSFKLKSNSGGIKAEKLEGKGTVDTTSGGFNCGELSITGDTRLESRSGAVKVTMSEGQNLAYEISSRSGSLRTGDYPFTFDKSGKTGYCTSGDGSAGKLTIDTTSGTISVS